MKMTFFAVLLRFLMLLMCYNIQSNEAGVKVVF